MPIKIGFWLLLALLAFAGNSIFARLALAPGAMDPYTFTLIRLFAASLVLGLLLSAKPRAWANLRSSIAPTATLALFVYALGFSLAYVSLSTGAGALILFGLVQLTMLAIKWYRGHRSSVFELAGVALAILGLIYLMLPSAEIPSSMTAAVLMALAGMAWGVYSALGAGATQPLQQTAVNFIATIPLQGLLLLWLFYNGSQWDSSSVVWAVLSGAVTSALGYAIWYRVLPHLALSSAAVAQLSVPLLAAFGGALFSAEPLTLRFAIAAGLILGGIYLVIRFQQLPAQQR